jgi:predicted alpha/beta hydrolase family esterase
MVVLVYGYDGSGPGHWQRWLENELRRLGIATQFPDLSNPASPDKNTWVEELAAVVYGATAPVILVAHSLGCWAVDHFVDRYGAKHIESALLVAPPSPHLIFEPVESFFPPPRNPEAWAPIAAKSLIVGSDDDDFIGADELREIGSRLGLSVRLECSAGHINPSSGFGPWPFSLDWVLSRAILESQASG